MDEPDAKDGIWFKKKKRKRKETAKVKGQWLIWPVGTYRNTD